MRRRPAGTGRPPLRVVPQAGSSDGGALRALEALGIDGEVAEPGVHGDLWCLPAEGLRAALHLLLPLERLVDPLAWSDLQPAARRRATVGGRCVAVPRTADVRVWWARRDRAPDSVATWSGLARSGLPVAIPTRGPAVGEVFWELVTAHGGRLVDDELRPLVTSPEAEEALDELRRVARRSPEQGGLDEDRVPEQLALGRAVAGPLWWSCTGTLIGTPAYGELDPHPVPAGPYHRRAWLRTEVWAIPRSCLDVDAAVDALVTLCGPEAAERDEAAGLAPAHREATRPHGGDDASQSRARVIAGTTLAHDVVPAPPLARLAPLGAALADPLGRAVRGEQAITEALQEAQEAAERAVR